MQYFRAKQKEHNRERIYRAYITDALKAAYNLNLRYEDLIKEVKHTQEDAEEIKARIKAKLRKLSGEK